MTSPRRCARSVRRTFFALAGLFLVTGGCGLLLEQIYERMLSTIVGASTPAGAVVLAVFFLGLTLGGGAWARLAPAIARPLRAYAALEAFVAVWAALLWILLPVAHELSSRLIMLGADRPPAVFALRLVTASIWILPPTLAMGATFPAIVAVLQSFRLRDLSRSMARFYGLNLAGAFIGAVIGPYLLFPYLGFGRSLALLAATELAVAAVAFRLARNSRPARGSFGATTDRPGWPPPILIAAAFLSGFVFFGFEVIWTHLIAGVLGNSVYAFANMLAAVLLGLGAGALASSRNSRRSNGAGALRLAWLLVAAGGVLLACSLGWDRVTWLIETLGGRVHGFAAGEVVRFSIATLLIGPPALLLGMVFPLLFRLPEFPRERASSAAGILGAVNAVGCIGGALAVGFVLLPGLGSEASYRLLAFVVLLSALVVAARSAFARPAGKRAAELATLVTAIAGLCLVGALPAWNRLELTSGAHVYFQRLHVTALSRLLYWHEDTHGGFTTVISTPRGDPGLPPISTLLTNGKFEGNDANERAAQIAFALVPILHTEARGRALVIGLGTGQTAHVIEAAGFGRIDVAEIAPGIVEAAGQHFAHVNGNVLRSPAVAVHLEDGRNFLLRSAARFDLITIELNSVWFMGAGNLYSREFYRVARDRMTDHGVFQQWIQFHHIAPREVLGAIATLRDVFPHVKVFYVGGQGLMVASKSPLEPSVASYLDLVRRPSLEGDRALMKSISGLDLAAVARSVVLAEASTTRVLEAARRGEFVIDTDSNRYLEYWTPRHNLESAPHVDRVIEAFLGVRGVAIPATASPAPAP